MTIADGVNLANEVLSKFSHAERVFTDPMFLARFALAAVEVAAAPDDETRRGIVQAEVLKLEREFK